MWCNRYAGGLGANARCDCRRCWARLPKTFLSAFGWYRIDPDVGLAKAAFFGLPVGLQSSRTLAADLYGVRWHGRAAGFFLHRRVREAYDLPDDWPETAQLGDFRSYLNWRGTAQGPPGRFAAHEKRATEARRAVDRLAERLARYVWDGAGSGWRVLDAHGGAEPMAVIVSTYELGGLAAVEDLVCRDHDPRPSKLFAEFTASG